MRLTQAGFQLCAHRPRDPCSFGYEDLDVDEHGRRLPPMCGSLGPKTGRLTSGITQINRLNSYGGP